MPAATSPYQPLQTNHSKPTTQLLLAVLVTIAVTVCVAPTAKAQISLGSVTNVSTDPVPCSSVNSAF